ncbi:MAG TPA: SPASM domain-containing protein, partial [Polyangiaceae bacterium]
VMAQNLTELADIAVLMHEMGVDTWEVFFLITTGRGTEIAGSTPQENEDVCNFLVDASRYGFIVRTVEAPFFRRVVAWRREGRPVEAGSLYGGLAERLRTLLGEPRNEPRAQTKGTRDGKGIVFVAHDGDVYPAGFLPITIGNVRDESLVDLYRESPLLRDIRAASFRGRCGACEYADLCGGSRARAYAASGDPLGEDPACAYVPTAVSAVPAA